MGTAGRDAQKMRGVVAAIGVETYDQTQMPEVIMNGFAVGTTEDAVKRAVVGATGLEGRDRVGRIAVGTRGSGSV